MISNLQATPDQDGNATVTWQTNEPATTRVRFGTDPGALTQDVSDPALTSHHSIKLTDLAPRTTIHFRATSADEEGNATTSPAAAAAPASFVTPASIVDTSTEDFRAGTAAGTYAGGSGAGTDGEVQLAPALAEDFDAPGLPFGWSFTPWTGGVASIVDSSLAVDGARAGTDAVFTRGRTRELVGVLGTEPYRHFGLGDDLNGPPWAIFSTGGGNGLFARTAAGASEETPIAGVSPAVPHRYRIDWNTAGVQYSIDGVQVASHAIAVAADMRPIASDYLNGNGDVRIDWVRMSPYASSGTFTSRVLDAGAVADWTAFETAQATPTGTQISFETRSGATATPDASWSAWAPVGSSGAVASPNARRLQYRATISTASARDTATLQRVRVGYVLTG